MDSTAVQTGGALGIVTFVGTILYKLYVLFNHKKIRIRCCNDVYELGFDVDNSTPASRAEDGGAGTGGAGGASVARVITREDLAPEVPTAAPPPPRRGVRSWSFRKVPRESSILPI